MWAFCLKWFRRVFLVGCTWMGWCLDFDDLPKEALYREFVIFTRKNAPEVVFWGSLIWLVLNILHWKYGPKHPAELTIDKLATNALDRFRKAVFPGVETLTDPDHHNRVTLFKHNDSVGAPDPWFSCIWPWGLRCPPWATGWLIATARSGHATSKLKSKFYCPDDGESGAGVASEAYFNGSMRAPELPAFDRSYTPHLFRVWLNLLCLKLRLTSEKIQEFEHFWKDVTTYAIVTKTTKYSVWYRIRRNRACPVNMLGVRINNSRGEVWGVLVMDSSNHVHCVDSNDQNFKKALTMLRKDLIQLGVIE